MQIERATAEGLVRRAARFAVRLSQRRKLRLHAQAFRAAPYQIDGFGADAAIAEERTAKVEESRLETIRHGGAG